MARTPLGTQVLSQSQNQSAAFGTRRVPAESKLREPELINLHLVNLTLHTGCSVALFSSENGL
jgi:hypothetical protein